MPSRNVIKDYVANSYYHLYNRGVEKRIIFLDEQDYGVFLGYLKEYLLPKDEDFLYSQLSNPATSSKEKDKIIKKLRLNNFADKIALAAYCLMPNHFHLLLKQTDAESINIFMRSLGTRYTMYFNGKYNRVGGLFQSVYKGVLVKTDDQLLHLTRYIHKQALRTKGETLRAQPSSYAVYLQEQKVTWVKPNDVLEFFSKYNDTSSSNTYKEFVEGSEDFGSITKLLLD